MKYSSLETARLVLRERRTEDLYEYARNPQAGRWRAGRLMPTGRVRWGYGRVIRRVIEKCGFEYELTLENTHTDYDGHVSDGFTEKSVNMEFPGF